MVQVRVVDWPKQSFFIVMLMHEVIHEDEGSFIEVFGLLEGKN
jgi:hypothetical protein